MFNNEYYIQGDQDVQIPAHSNFGKYILNELKVFRDEIALENAETKEKLKYIELTQYAVKLAKALTAKLGITKGDVVALGSEKHINFIPTVLAIILSGATYTPYDVHSGKAHLLHKMNITQPKYFICSKLFWETNQEVLETFDSIQSFVALDDGDFDSPKCTGSVKALTSDLSDADILQYEPAVVLQTDTACILYSSGTTGMPKGVKLSHLNCILNSLPHDFSDENLKTAFVTGDWFHNYDSFMTFKMLTLGRKIVYTTEVTPEKIIQVLETHQVNTAFVVPSTVIWLSKIDEQEQFELSSLKVVYSRSSPLLAKTIDKLKKRFPSIEKIIQGYGMTEAGELTSENWGSKGPRPGSVGCASPFITLKVVHPETNKLLGPNERGEICLAGPVFMSGYINIDPSTYLDEEGFFKTGDLGYYDEDGYFYIVDRLKEIIVYDGNKVAPLELETILRHHPAVIEAGVVGKPHPIYGEEPTAFLVLKEGHLVPEQDFIDYVAAEVPPYMQLRGGVRFISEIPKNPRGKILRRRLREMLNEANSEN